MVEKVDSTWILDPSARSAIWRRGVPTSEVSSHTPRGLKAWRIHVYIYVCIYGGAPIVIENVQKSKFPNLQKIPKLQNMNYAIHIYHKIKT